MQVKCLICAKRIPTLGGNDQNLLHELGFLRDEVLQSQIASCQQISLNRIAHVDA